MLSQLCILVLAIGIADLGCCSPPQVFSTTAYRPSGAPNLPVEFVANFRQHKWDYDGNGVSHVATGTFWHSYERKMIRIDSTAHDWKSNNATIRGPRSGSMVISVYDFRQTSKNGIVVNTVYKIWNMNRSECAVYKLPIAQSSNQLFSEDYLRLHNAGYSGQEDLVGQGLADKWTMFFGPTFATIYFDQQGNYIRMDFVEPPPDKASVVTYYFNLDNSYKVIANEVFDGLTCPNNKPLG